MSLTDPVVHLTSPGFPRASGDEPSTPSGRESGLTFSPRERG